ncbi:hypothetical protein [Pyxidicoccus xibeiensis]|uniref:hypothetical protein n=1 Tax=Pyxidicoccus xibeiensis TaxID=2906759 RepID=UPI0020A7E8D5|nr:hypothetical protein [Pyxidicoccus xibeiensis]MCP3143856.1 hypothetical protein [Pyxidicoccus xibeiensis]
MNRSVHDCQGAVRILVMLLMPMLAGCSIFSPYAVPQRRVKLSEHERSDGGDSSVAFSTSGDLRLAFLREENAKSVYCAEPMPDVALGSEQSGSGSLSAAASLTQSASAANSAALSEENEALRKDLRDAILAYEEATERRYNRSVSSNLSSSTSSNASLNLQATYKLAVTVAELGGRSHQVLLAREFLYRLCEARANGFFTSQQAYVELQVNALKMIQSIAMPARPSANAERAELVKKLNEYVTTQTELCKTQQSACTTAAADDAAKKVCAAAFNKCVSAIVTPKLPAEEPEDKAKRLQTPSGWEFELTVPKINEPLEVSGRH